MQVNRPFKLFLKKLESNDIFIHFEEVLNIHSSDRSSKTTQSNLFYKNVKMLLDPDSLKKNSKVKFSPCDQSYLQIGSI